MSKEIEEWRDIKGYEGLYQVSDWGNVRKVCKHKTKQIAKGLLKGYLRVHLWKEGKSKHHFLHRLVAEAFIDNPENKPCVGHLKTMENGIEDKTANEAWNLAWMTYEENMNYGTLPERSATRQLNREDESTPINAYYYPSMDFICMFPSQSEAERRLNLHNVNKVLKGIYKQEKGYTFRYV